MIDGNEAQALNDLKQHRGWQYLGEMFARKRERWERLTIRGLLDQGDPIDQRDIDYMRGYMDAWQEMLAAPDQAEQRFERALRKRGQS